MLFDFVCLAREHHGLYFVLLSESTESLFLCFGSSLCLLFHWIAKWQKSNFILFSPFISWIIAIQVILIMGKHPFSNYLLILWYSLHWQGKIKLYFVLFNRKIKMMLIPQHHSKVTKEDFLSFWFFFFFFAFSH